MAKSSQTQQAETAPVTSRPTSPAYPGAPRWVKVAVIIFIVVLLLFVFVHLTGNSPMGSHLNMNSTPMPSTPLGAPSP